MRDRILKYALQNAVFYSGKANPKAVLGRVMANEPELRKNLHQVRIEVESVVNEVNTWGLEKQIETLKEIAPELLEKEKKEEKGLPELPQAVPGKVVTRFAPAPTGPLNISHMLRAVMLSYLYAEKYDGKFILRFDDTDARRIEKKFYRMIEEDLKMCGVVWHRKVITSDDMPLYYRYAEKLIRESKAYMCACDAETFRKLKLKKLSCPCRSRSAEENLDMWEAALQKKYKEGEVALRFMTSMSDPNPALRDPVIMRISKDRHPIQGRKYDVWPLYNYAAAIEDHRYGITHVFRGKEHEHNTEVQRRIYEALGWEPPVVVNFGMIYTPGEKLHTRDIKDAIRRGEYSGWDDPRLHTIRALVRRGFVAEAFRKYAEHCSLTKTDIRLDWETFESYNRKAIDGVADRFMVVIDPVKISMKRSGLAGKKVFLRNHPERVDTREVKVTENIYVSKDDFIAFKGREVRLKELATGIMGKTFRPTGEDTSVQKIQWVPERNIKVTVVKPDALLRGVGEPALKKLREGRIIQMERIGFGRVDNKSRDCVTVFFAHK